MVKQVGGSSGLTDNSAGEDVEEDVDELMFDLEVENELRLASQVPLNASRGALSAALPKKARSPPKKKTTPKSKAAPKTSPKGKAAPKPKTVPKDDSWERKKAACRAYRRAITIAKAEGKSKDEINMAATEAYAAVVASWVSAAD